MFHQDNRDITETVQFFLKNGYVHETNEEKMERLELEKDARQEDDYEMQVQKLMAQADAINSEALNCNSDMTQ